MSNQANIDLLETIFEEVQEAFPYLDEEKQIEIANNRFWEIAQWNSKTRTGTLPWSALAIRGGDKTKNGQTPLTSTFQELKRKFLS